LSLLELRDVGARYGEIRALHGVSLSVAEGDFVALLGANGAGKTTTLRAISGTVRTSGDVLVDGSKVFRRTPESMARSGVAHVPEGRGTFTTLSVLDNLRLGAWVHGNPSPRDLAHVFEFFPRLYERRGQQAGLLSGGEQQMLALGRAMMAKPRVLLLDEPSLGLAPQVIESVFAFVRAVRQEGTAIVLVEQNARLALETADRALVMQRGRVALEGPARELARDPRVRDVYLGRRETSVTPAAAEPNLESEER
jgi:branched-chain amino acid transport system ATP-binding protein